MLIENHVFCSILMKDPKYIEILKELLELRFFICYNKPLI